MSQQRFQRFFLSHDASREEIEQFVQALHEQAAKSQDQSRTASEGPDQDHDGGNELDVDTTTEPTDT